MRDQVAWLYKQAAARGLIAGSSGNVSGRTPDGMMITPSGCDPETATDLVRLGMDGTVAGGWHTLQRVGDACGGLSGMR